MKISVVIPTYNRAHTLVRTLDSVISQTYPAFEVIVVDDGSSDRTSQLLDRYPQIRRITLCENGGVSRTRNLGIDAARGEWIALLDSDDVWQLDKLEKQRIAAEQSPAIKVIHSDEIWVRNGRRVNPMNKHAKPDGWIYEHSLPLCCVSPSSVLIHRSIFNECGVFDEKLPACEDYDLWLRVFSRYPVKLVSEALLVKYGGHEDQLSRQYWGMDRFRLQALRKILESGSLGEQQTRMTIEMLRFKCTILINGANKRGNHQLANQYTSLMEQYPLAAEAV